MDEEHNGSEADGVRAALDAWSTDQHQMVRHSPTWEALTAFTKQYTNGQESDALIHNASRLGRARRRRPASERRQRP
jgi:hypothetical protein